jgi:WD40 repeat protein
MRSCRRGLAFSSDSQWVAAACADGPVVFNAVTGDERPRPAIAGGASAVAFSPDDRWIAAACNDGTIRVFAAETGAAGAVARLSDAVGVGSVVFSADGQWVAGLVEDGPGVFRAADGSPRFAHLADVPEGGIVIYSADLRHIAVNQTVGTVSVPGLAVLDARTGAPAWQATTSDRVVDIAYSNDGRRIAAGGVTATESGFLNIYDTGMERSRRPHQGPVTGIAVAAGGIRLVATASGDQKASIFHADSGELLLEEAHPGVVTSIEFSPDGQFFATGGTDGGVRMFETVSGRRLWLVPHGQTVNMIAFSPIDRAGVGTGSDDKTARLLSRDSGEERWRRTHPQAVKLVAVSRDGRWVATGCGDRSTRVLSAATGEELFRFQHDGKVRSVAFGPTGSVLATGNDDGTVLLIDPATGQELGQVVHPRSVSAVAISPDGSLLVTGGDKAVRLTDLATGTPVLLQELIFPAPITRLAFNPIDRLLAVVTEDNVVLVIDPSDGIGVCRFIHPASVRDIAFSPDGELIATACDDAIARVFSGR